LDPEGVSRDDDEPGDGWRIFYESYKHVMRGLKILANPTGE
jgi:hypothetical protein